MMAESVERSSGGIHLLDIAVIDDNVTPYEIVFKIIAQFDFIVTKKALQSL